MRLCALNLGGLNLHSAAAADVTILSKRIFKTATKLDDVTFYCNDSNHVLFRRSLLETYISWVWR